MLKTDLGKENCSKYFKTRNDSSEEASDRKEASHREQIVSSPHLGHAHSCKGGPAHWTLWTIFKNRCIKKKNWQKFEQPNDWQQTYFKRNKSKTETEKTLCFDVIF